MNWYRIVPEMVSESLKISESFPYKSSEAIAIEVAEKYGFTDSDWVIGNLSSVLRSKGIR